MRAVLHILTRPEDTLARDIIAWQRAQPEYAVQVVDLTEGEPDYDKLLDSILGADSVQVW
jgi:hypothetical protein